VPDLAGHDGARDACGAEGVDEAGEFAEREPVDADGGVGGGARVDLGIGLLADGGDDHREALGARGVEQHEREAPVPGDEAELGSFNIHAGKSPNKVSKRCP